MAPATLATTSVVEDVTCTSPSRERRTNLCSHQMKSQYVRQESYDRVLPGNELKFMNPIRRCERWMGFQTPLIYYNIFFIVLFHLIAIGWLGYYILLLKIPMFKTIAFGFIMGSLAGFGITGGAHRYWSHRSYKARRPLQILLLAAYSMAGQNTIYEWVRDHRVHHKFSETSADPHDANRGFFFSHVGWLMMKKHPDVIREGRKIDMSDIEQDPLIRFHTRHFVVLKALLCFILPTLLPVYGWGETWDFAILSQFFLRYVLTLNFTWSVNSFAHLFGNKPYDRFIMPSENWGVSVVAMGEGWHNYHHTFPWDYKAAELAYSINLTTVFLDFFAMIGWAYDMKTASPSLIKAVANKRGDNIKSL